MPIQRCSKDGKQGWRWGKSGTCYTGDGALEKAKAQMRAAYAAGYVENQRRRSPNPLRADPTRTTTLRRLFARAFRVRFSLLKRRVRELVVEEDTFGLKTDLMFNARNQVSQRWRFKTSPQKLAEFQKWLEEQIDETVLDGGLPAEDAYWKAYVEEGYRKGAGRAFDDVRKAEAATAESLDFYAGTREEFLRSSFAAPETVEKVKGLAARTFTELKGVTSQVATQLNRELADGLTQGQNPRKIAARMAKKIDSLGKRRAETIARTEIIRAHAEGQLDTYDRLQKPTIKVMAEWSTAGDDRVCPLCLPLDGVVMKVKEARGTIPRHPNCRCSFMPANVGEPTKGQQRTPEQAKRAIAESIKREAPEGRSLGRQRELSKWVGADVKPTQRPKPFVAKGNK